MMGGKRGDSYPFWFAAWPVLHSLPGLNTHSNMDEGEVTIPYIQCWIGTFRIADDSKGRHD